LVELEIPKILQKENLNAADVARQLKIHPLTMARVLNACVSLGLLQNNTSDSLARIAGLIGVNRRLA